MAKTVLLTLGRLPKALDIARALAGVGCRVLIAEPFGMHVCSPSRDVAKCLRVTSPVEDDARYLAELEQIITREGVDLVIPVSEEAMYAAGLHGRAGHGATVFGPDRDLIRDLHDKASFIDRARGYGLAVPETARLGTAQAETLASRQPTVLKHVYSSAGIGVRFLDAGAKLPPASDTPTLVQARLPGRARNTVSIAHDGRVLGTTAYEGTIMSHTVSVAFRRIDAPDLEAWVETFVAASGYSGFIAFDFIDDADGVPRAIECNPRANSGLHFFDPPDLARALLAPGETRSIGHRPERLMQQFFPCLTETQGALFDPEKRRSNLHYLRRSKDVTWQARDPLPFILMTVTSWKILQRAFVNGESFGEAAVADIAWRGPGQSAA